MFLLDGKRAEIADDDYGRLFSIACMLHKWGLVKLDTMLAGECEGANARVKVIPYKDKENWTLVSKYTIGKGGDQ